MLSSSSRVVVRPAVRVASMRTALPRHRVARFSTSMAARAEQASSSSAGAGFGAGAGGAGNTSAFASGLAGGALVLVGGVVMYQFSDVKKYINTANQAKQYAQQTKDKVSASISNTKPADALGALRGLVKSYAGLIPGVGTHVDATFDELEKIVDKHGDKASDIVKKAYDEVKDIVSSGSVDVETARKLADVLGKRVGELQELGMQAGEDILDAHPEVKKKLGGGYDQLRKLANEKGPEAKKAFEEVQSQLKDILKEGPTPENLNKAYKLVQDKTQQLRNTLEPAARDAWDGALKKAQPYLDKVPELRDTLDSNVGALAPNAKEVFDRVKKIAEAKGSERDKLVKDFKGYVEEAAGSASDSFPSVSWEDAIKYVKSVPGGEALLEKVPNAEALAKLSKDKGGDAAKLAKETWDEVLEVLSKKADKAKDLADGTASDAKKAATK